MNSGRIILKQSKGWFAAGKEFERALAILSDGAFKLYAYACLHADRHTGRLPVQSDQLARVLHQDKDAIAAHVAELQQSGVSYSEIDDSRVTMIEIRDFFWPYEKQKSDTLATGEQEEFIAHGRRLFLEHSCVRSMFSASDEQTAIDLYRKGCTLDQLSHAILLGCVRKYVAMINRQTVTPITSLQYFVGVLNEIAECRIPESYWRALTGKVNHLEQQWLRISSQCRK